MTTKPEPTPSGSEADSAATSPAARPVWNKEAQDRMLKSLVAGMNELMADANHAVPPAPASSAEPSKADPDGR